jgi:DNA-binding MarR family transcriptional regulator
VKIEEAIRQRTFKSPLQKAILNLIYTSSWFLSQQDAFFQEADLTSQQYNVLRILRGAYPKALCAGDIKAVMLDKNPDLTRLCDRLLRKNLIVRELNEQNRRQVLVQIAPEGVALLEHLEPKIQAAASKFDHLTDAEATQLSDLLDKLRG